MTYGGDGVGGWAGDRRVLGRCDKGLTATLLTCYVHQSAGINRLRENSYHHLSSTGTRSALEVSSCLRREGKGWLAYILTIHLPNVWPPQLCPECNTHTHDRNPRQPTPFERLRNPNVLSSQAISAIRSWITRPLLLFTLRRLWPPFSLKVICC